MHENSHSEGRKSQTLGFITSWKITGSQLRSQQTDILVTGRAKGERPEYVGFLTFIDILVSLSQSGGFRGEIGPSLSADWIFEAVVECYAGGAPNTTAIRVSIIESKEGGICVIRRGASGGSTRDHGSRCMTKVPTNEQFTTLKEPEREFRSSRRHFKTLSLDELRSPDFNLFYDQENSEEEVAEIMAETIEQYMSNTRDDYGSGVARPKIEDKDNLN
ncbi:hypothetical protein Tco_0096773 [Tanacetum coccineum]|uniref:Uncharacterized protein n=1 Tax=Tanacetum coccineum TaxID=301880 RepID=A0ABQ5AY13_9ASTR